MYGNSAGRNKGKKYKKLTGNEIATPEAEGRAKRFLNWYGATYRFIARGIRDHDEEVAVDTMLQVYNDILYKDLHVGNYRTYYLRAYHTTKLKRALAEAKEKARFSDVDEAEDIPVSDFDFMLYESAVEQLNMEMLAYVRLFYAPMEVSLFEIYMGLQPEVSYSAMAAMLGLSPNRIYLAISAIKRDLRLKFTQRRKNLLSSI